MKARPMTELPYRPFADDAAIHRIGEGLLARTLPRADWTHEAHLAATLWLIRDRPDVDVNARIATIISRYNESVGGVNDDHQGYHDTITHVFVAGIRLHLAGRPADEPLANAVNSLLASPIILHAGQAAILGVGKLEKRVVVREVGGQDAILIRPMAYVTLTIDHRVVDGHQTNGWLSRFVEILEKWPAD